ncbi:MAG: FG-GAP-like repeat-containing protein [Ferruginibacter sp.]
MNSFKRNFIFFLSVNLFISLGALCQPVISTLTPSNGPVGTTVVISGSGFSSTASSNIVNFAGIRASVTNASTNTITVTVPYGTSPHVPVSVTTGGLTAYSEAPFITTFPGANGPFSTNSFQSAPNISAPGNPTDVAVGDLDLDGKIDFVAISLNSWVSIYKNTSTTPAIGFSASTNIDNILYAYSVALGDVDGDGLLDIIVGSSNNSADSISVYKNQSSVGSISFAPAQRFAAAGAYSVTMGDVDADGKPDIISTNSNGIFVFRNTSSGGIISFNSRLSFLAGQSPQAVVLRDLNANGKPDLIVLDGNSIVLVLNNTSSMGNISFDPAQNVGYVYTGMAVAVADLDGDNKPEIAVSGYSAGAISILKNTSSGGTISFGAPLNLNVSNPWGVQLADMNGDGKLDVVCPQYSLSQNVVVFRNTSNGSLSFDAGVNYYTGARNFQVAIADLRNSGLPDIITLERDINAIAFFKNKANDPPAFSSFNPTSAGQGYEVTITGTNLSSVTAVSFGGVPATSINIVSSTSIKAMVGTGATGDVVVSSPAGSASQPGFIFTIAPTISSFIPLSGPVGQVVKISGTNFSSTPANNIVYFGAVKAVVNSATTSSLFVTVPAGATFQPISVTTNGYTVYSRQVFNTTFPDADITLSTFIKKITLVEPYQTIVGDITMADIDGDGLPDIIVPHHGTVLSDVNYRDSFAVYRNTTVNGVISFAKRIAFKTTGSFSSNIGIGDFNSDGKLDIAVTNQVFNTFYGNYAAVDLFRNTSTPGVISFAAPVVINAGNYPSQVSIADLDGDGKADLAVANGTAGFYIFKNACSGTTISFINRQYIPIPGGGASSVCLADLDGDNKPDVLASNSISNEVAIFRNMSSIGTISLLQVAGFDAGRRSTYVTMADLDSDGKKDIILGSGSYSHSSVQVQDTAVIIGRNLSTPGNISFDAAITYPMYFPANISIGDLDGNNKPDIITSNNNQYFTILKNTSTPGALSMAPEIRYLIGNFADGSASAVGDLDGDAKPDILIVDDNTSSDFLVYINQNGSDAELCPNGSKTIRSNITGSYQWQLNTGSGFTNITNGVNYSGVTTVALNLVNIPSSWYGYKYRCVVSGNYSKTFTIKFVNRWTGAVNASWEQPGNWSCGTIPDSNTDVVISSGPVTLSSNTTIRSLIINPDVIFTVNPGVILTILH